LASVSKQAFKDVQEGRIPQYSSERRTKSGPWRPKHKSH
jgi:hypothetical protein